MAPTFKIWVEIEEIDVGHYESHDPVDIVVGLGTYNEAGVAKGLIVGAPELARRAAKKFSDVAEALDEEMSGLECLGKYGDACANYDDDDPEDDPEDQDHDDDGDICAVCAHMDATLDTEEIIEALRDLGDLAGPEEGFEGDE